MELLLIRHALPIRIEGEEGTAADPELADLGHEQARALADYLAGERVDVLYTSPLRRALQTAGPVAAQLGLETIVDEELAEFDRHSHFYIPIEELKQEKDERWDDLVEGRWGVDGEVDPATFKAVVVEAVERVIAAHPGKTVAIVCHGGVINAYYAHLLDLEFPMFFEPAYTSISRVLASSAGQRQVKSINEHGHVRALI
jgi:2,3-bisphosphoglycerate-dependent phosphoglycerate mutase